MAKLRVRDFINGGWVDIRDYEWFVRTQDNGSWVQIYAGNILMRNHVNNDWIYIDSNREDDEFACPADDAPTNCNGGQFNDPRSGSGNGIGSGGPEYRPDVGYPPGYDLPDASGGFFELQKQRMGVTGVCIRRPGLNVCESYDGRSNIGQSGAGTWIRPADVGAASWSIGARVTEIIYKLPATIGTVQIPFVTYTQDEGVSLDVYYAGERVATTCGPVKGANVLCFNFEPVRISVGAAQYTEQNIMIRVRALAESVKWCLQVLPQQTAPSCNPYHQRYYGKVTWPYVCNATVVADMALSSIQRAVDSFHFMGPDEGVVYLDYITYSQAERIDVLYHGKPLATTEYPAVGPGTLRFVYDPAVEPGIQDICVRVISPPTGITNWRYTIYCPGDKGSRELEWACGALYKSSGHPEVEVIVHLGANPPADQYMKIQWDMRELPDYLEIVTQQGRKLFRTDGGQQGPGEARFAYNPATDGNRLMVRVQGPLRTDWEFILHCPGAFPPPPVDPPVVELMFPINRCLTWNDDIATNLGFGTRLGAAPSDGQTYIKDINHRLDDIEGSFIFSFVVKGQCTIRFQVFNGDSDILSVDTLDRVVNGYHLDYIVFEFRRSVSGARFLKVRITLQTVAGQDYKWGYSFSEPNPFGHNYFVPPFKAGWILEALPSQNEFRGEYSLMGPVGDPPVMTPPYNLPITNPHNSVRAVWYDAKYNGNDNTRDDYMIWYGQGSTEAYYFSRKSIKSAMAGFYWKMNPTTGNRAKVRIISGGTGVPASWRLAVSSELAAWAPTKLGANHYKLVPRATTTTRTRYVYPAGSAAMASPLSVMHPPFLAKRTLDTAGDTDSDQHTGSNKQLGIDYHNQMFDLIFTVDVGTAAVGSQIYFTCVFGKFPDARVRVTKDAAALLEETAVIYTPAADIQGDVLHAANTFVNTNQKIVVNMRIPNEMIIGPIEAQNFPIEFYWAMSKPVTSSQNGQNYHAGFMVQADQPALNAVQEYFFEHLIADADDDLFAILSTETGNDHRYRLTVKNANGTTLGTADSPAAGHGSMVRVVFKNPGNTVVNLEVTRIQNVGTSSHYIRFTVSNPCKGWVVDPYDTLPGQSYGPAGHSTARTMETIYLSDNALPHPDIRM